MVLAKLESERLKFDRYLAPHYNFYSRAMRLKAYEQFLTPYKTVSLHFEVFLLNEIVWCKVPILSTNLY